MPVHPGYSISKVPKIHILSPGLASQRVESVPHRPSTGKGYEADLVTRLYSDSERASLAIKASHLDITPIGIESTIVCQEDSARGALLVLVAIQSGVDLVAIGQ